MNHQHFYIVAAEWSVQDPPTLKIVGIIVTPMTKSYQPRLPIEDDGQLQCVRIQDLEIFNIGPEDYVINNTVYQAAFINVKNTFNQVKPVIYIRMASFMEKDLFKPINSNFRIRFLWDMVRTLLNSTTGEHLFVQ